MVKVSVGDGEGESEGVGESFVGIYSKKKYACPIRKLFDVD